MFMFNKKQFNAYVCFSRFKKDNNLTYDISQLQYASRKQSSKITNIIRSTDSVFQLEYDSCFGPRSLLAPVQVAYLVDSG